MVLPVPENDHADERAFPLYAPDYPGFGLSTAPTGYDFLASTHSEVLADVVEELGLSDIILVMQDWGGPIGLAVAELFPERVRGMVIGNTWAWPLKGELRMEVFSWIMVVRSAGRWHARLTVCGDFS